MLLKSYVCSTEIAVSIVKRRGVLSHILTSRQITSRCHVRLTHNTLERHTYEQILYYKEIYHIRRKIKY